MIMIKRALLLGSIIFGCLIISNAQVWRLNNIAGVDADFTSTLQDAIDNVSDGDTIHVEQSPFSYGAATIDKKVTLIGAGYWLSENDSTQANIEKSMVEDLILNPGSEGTTICGLYIYKVFPNSTNWILIELNADSITIQRNYIFGTQISCPGNTCTGENIVLRNNRKDILIQQNWIESIHQGHIPKAILIEGIPDTVVIQNNFIKPKGTSSPTYDNAIVEMTSHVSTGLIIKNNIIWGNIYVYNALHVNNILLSGTYYNEAAGLTSNNLCNEDQYPDINNNQQYVDMSTVFIDHDLNIDNGYMLKSGSPAIGTGFNDGDCGVFGYGYGGKPYVLSGLPAIPAIFEVNFNNTIFPVDSTTLQMNIKAKSHN